MADEATRRRTDLARSERTVELEPIKSTRIYEEIVRQVKAMIAEGRLKSGDQLPPERDLAEMSLEFRREQARAGVDLGRVAEALSTGSALVSYARYGERPTRISPATVDSVPSYLAFVLRGGSREVEAVALGEAGPLDSLVARWREQASRGARIPGRFLNESDYRAAGEALRRRIWDPVAARLGDGVRRVFVIPDAALNLVNLAALPAADGKYLIESGPLVHYLTTERDLAPTVEEKVSGSGLLAIGGPDVGQAAPAIRSALLANAAGPNAQPYRGARSNCGEFRSLRWERLPGALRECKEIASMWRGFAPEAPGGATPSLGAGAPVLLDGAQATEAAFKALAPGRRVLHLATHGFFVQGRCASGPDLMPAEDSPGGPVENPLVLSGLALAGANRRDAARANE